MSNIISLTIKDKVSLDQPASVLVLVTAEVPVGIKHLNPPVMSLHSHMSKYAHTHNKNMDPHRMDLLHDILHPVVGVNLGVMVHRVATGTLRRTASV